MPKLDFPPTPAVGAIYPQPPIPNQPVYMFDGIKWTTDASTIDDIIGPSSTLPKMDGIAATGIEGFWAHGDHVHPTDASRAPVTSPTFLVDAKAPTPATASNSTNVATTAFVAAAIAASPAGASAPVDALAYSGLQINGSFAVNQEKPTGQATTTDGGYICDGWKLGKVGTMAAQAGTGFDATMRPAGFPTRVLLDTTTGQPSLGANDMLYIAQPVEGTRTGLLAWGTASAQSITVGFWSKNALAGVYSVAILGSLSYTTTYTQAAANTLQYNTVVIPGAVSGTWGIDTSVGFTLVFAAAAGTARIAPVANSWAAGQYYAAPGQINAAAAATGNILAITGVVIIPGIVTIPSARSALITRPYSDELRTCQRYFQISRYAKNNYAFGAGMAISTSKALYGTRFPTMRAAPVIALSAFTDFGNWFDAGTSTSAATAFSYTSDPDTATLSVDCNLFPPGQLTIRAAVMLLAFGDFPFITYNARL